MAIYQRGENWYIEFIFKGKKIRESIGPDRRLAEKVIRKRKTEIAENKYLDIKRDPDPLPFHQFGVEYVKWAKTNKKPLSWKQDSYKLQRLDKEFGDRDLRKITTWEIEKYKSKRKEKLGPSAVNGELRLLKHLYSKAIEWGQLTENPAKRVKLMKGEKQRVRFLSPEEIGRFISNCANHLRPIVIVALNTGMRRTEILTLKWEQVNLDQGIITLLDTKNHETGRIPMNETVKATLKEIPQNGEYVFSNGNGGRFTALKKSFETAKRKSGIEDFHFHDLRHCFASNLVMLGVDIMTVKELMRHKSLTMTLRYAHLAPDHKTKAVFLLDANHPQKMLSKDTESRKVVNL